MFEIVHSAVESECVGEYGLTPQNTTSIMSASGKPEAKTQY